MNSKRWRTYRMARAARKRRAATDNDADDTTKLAKTADDLDAIRKSVEDAASVSAGLWLSYLFVLFYFAVAAGAVTHADLLLENSVKLPFLSIELPLVAFFLLAPLIFLVVHAYTMVHFVLLAKKAVRFNDRLYEQFPYDDTRTKSIRDGLRLQLPSNIFVQFLAGPSEIRDSGFGRLLKLIAWTTLVFGPIALLLLLQIQFLPFHHARITWTHRVALFADLLIVWWLWRKILHGRGDLRGWRTWKTWTKTSIAFAASACTFLFSWTVATFPGEWQATPLKWFSLVGPATINAAIFNGDVDPTTHRRVSWFSNTLVLPGFTGTNVQKGDMKGHSIDLRGRHLEGAVFNGANFGTEADLTGAYLQAASLNGTQLQGAKLDGAQLQGATLAGSQLQGASFDRAQLQGASLYVANAEGASFEDASFQGSRLDYAQLHGAVFFLAHIAGTTFVKAELFGATFERADLVAVDFSGASLWRSRWNDARAENLKDGSTDFGPGSWGPPRVQKWIHPGGAAMLVGNGFAPWSDNTYDALKQEIEKIPEGNRRTQALVQIGQLDCNDASLTPCNQASSPTQVFKSAVSSTEESFATALMAEMEKLVCRNPEEGPNGIRVVWPRAAVEQAARYESDAITSLRGLTKSYAIRIGGNAQELAAHFLSSDCLVSKLLTDDDKANLKEFLRSTVKNPESPAP